MGDFGATAGHLADEVGFEAEAIGDVIGIPHGVFEDGDEGVGPLVRQESGELLFVGLAEKRAANMFPTGVADDSGLAEGGFIGDIAIALKGREFELRRGAVGFESFLTLTQIVALAVELFEVLLELVEGSSFGQGEFREFRRRSVEEREAADRLILAILGGAERLFGFGELLINIAGTLRGAHGAAKFFEGDFLAQGLDFGFGAAHAFGEAIAGLPTLHVPFGRVEAILGEGANSAVVLGFEQVGLRVEGKIVSSDCLQAVAHGTPRFRDLASKVVAVGLGLAVDGEGGEKTFDSWGGGEDVAGDFESSELIFNLGQLFADELRAVGGDFDFSFGGGTAFGEIWIKGGDISNFVTRCETFAPAGTDGEGVLEAGEAILFAACGGELLLEVFVAVGGGGTAGDEGLVVVGTGFEGLLTGGKFLELCEGDVNRGFVSRRFIECFGGFAKLFFEFANVGESGRGEKKQLGDAGGTVGGISFLEHGFSALTQFLVAHGEGVFEFLGAADTSETACQGVVINGEAGFGVEKCFRIAPTADQGLGGAVMVGDGDADAEVFEAMKEVESPRVGKAE